MYRTGSHVFWPVEEGKLLERDDIVAEPGGSLKPALPEEGGSAEETAREGPETGECSANPEAVFSSIESNSVCILQLKSTSFTRIFV